MLRAVGVVVLTRCLLFFLVALQAQDAQSAPMQWQGPEGSREMDQHKDKLIFTLLEKARIKLEIKKQSREKEQEEAREPKQTQSSTAAACHQGSLQ
ncbi:hypothetical protein BTVI_146306 [Pitangus sulphuratus]|nr:hypothetical protein BTVI_146306 [Pitangus sulphuratus]